MTRTDQILEKFRHLNVWKRGDVRAPHKPLLVLYALGRLQGGANHRLIPYDEIDRPLTKLLDEFGPPRTSPHPELPFYHLQNDGVWEIEDRVPLRIRMGSKNPPKSELKKSRIAGGFTEDVYAELKRRPELVRELAREILAAHFPESLHDSICAAAGVSIDGTERSRRDPAFRSEVITAWWYRCVFCGYAVQLDGADLGLEAAHIRWCQAGGPDSLNNGLACCTVHHHAFDRGAITISDERRIVISDRLYGNGKLDDLFLALHGTALTAPNRRDALPKPEFLAWHRTQVFRGRPRD